MNNTLDCEILVVGSGPGGAITASLLAEAGRDVLLVEEGPELPLEKTRAYSLEEMNSKFRSGGVSVTLGKDKVAFVEARCLGGGSEINAGLYHRLPPSVTAAWREKYEIQDFGDEALAPFFEANEKDLSVGLLPGGQGGPAIRLQQGADQLGWHALEVPRWFKYQRTPDGDWKAVRQSMTRTFIPRARAAKCRVLTDTKVLRLDLSGRGRRTAMARTRRPDGTSVPLRMSFHTVFLCGGAVQTPFLLRRSGVTRHIGNSLKLHLYGKMVARFPEPINSLSAGVPVCQIKDFVPEFTLGCSVATRPYLVLTLLDHGDVGEKLHEWQKMAVYYVQAPSDRCGMIRGLPGFEDPLLLYPITAGDRNRIARGFKQLGRVLFAAGATDLYPSIGGCPVIRSEDELKYFDGPRALQRMSLMTIHLFSSIPMGENASLCGADSFGRLHGMDRVFVNDASLIPESPGVNPQGAVMALARRNVQHFLAGGE